MSDEDESRADARALAVALAQRDCETLFARCARADGAVTLDEDAQARLARALEISSKFSNAYAARVARAACKAIVAAGSALDDALAATLHARDDDAWERERDGWRDCVYAYTRERATPGEDDARARAIEAREMNARTALGTRGVDAIRARTQSDALAGSTGAYAWPAGFVASEFVMSRLASEALVRGRAVVELGSGVGVAGVAMARCAPAALVLTDRDARTLENLRDNVQLNVDMDGDGATRVVFDALDAPVSRRSTPGEALVVSVRDLDWERAPVEVLGAANADFVLAADCSYDPTLVPGLVRALGALLRARGADDESASTTLETLEARRAEEVIKYRYARTPCALVVSAVRQATTMRVLIDALERARLHPVDVTSAVAASRERAFLFADAARGHARDAFRAFACSATRVV
jgi:predicted nicotinamide N-methyase